MALPSYFAGSGAELIARVLDASGLNQRQLGELLGYHRRTIIRWLHGGATLLPSSCEKLAIACYARDRALAAGLAAQAGKTLVDLGLESPPAPPPPPAPAAAAVRPAPSARHLADSIVCSAAEAAQMTPQAARPAVLAAFERTCALGMTAEEVLAALAPPPAAKGEDETRPG